MSNDTVIDLRIGEARVVRDITQSLFSLDHTVISMSAVDWEYQPHGHKPLIKYLEDKHSAKVIVTNGATQALHAVMYALKQKGFNNMGVRLPYWNRIPEIAARTGIGCTPFVGNFFSEEKSDIDSYLLTMPNNPDGYMPSPDTVQECSGILKELDIPLIHDAVYYNPGYLPENYPISPIGDIQIYSASKTYGLSSLRIGYLVTQNDSFHKLMTDYMEFSTVGVSVPAQKMFLHLLKTVDRNQLLQATFSKAVREEIKIAKKTFKQVNPEYIEIPQSFDTACGVFAWVKPQRSDLFEKANIQVLKGDIFGMPGFVRINLAAGNHVIEELVKRINNV